MASRFWRLQTVKTFGGNQPSICELEMFSSVDPTLNLCVGGVASASSVFSSPTWDATKAFDGIKAGDNGWYAATSDKQAWIQYDFPSEVDVATISITSRSGGADITPTEFAVFYLDAIDNVWIPRFYHSGGSRWAVAANETRTFEANIEWDGTGIFTPRPLFNKGETDFRMGEGSFIIPYSYVNYKGDGYISGVLKEKGVPIPGVVSLVHPATQQIIKKMKTNSIGEYEFSGIRTDYEYDVIAQDANEMWEKKVSSKRKPYRKPHLDINSYSSETANIGLSS